jgi:hypothetical protein
MTAVRPCPRCEGSGRVYVTARESVTGRRRVYKGPAFADPPSQGSSRLRSIELRRGNSARQNGAAVTPAASVSAPGQLRRDKKARQATVPKGGVIAARQQQELSEALVKPKRQATMRKTSKTPKRDARSHVA